MALRLISGPAQEPILLSEAKAHLRVDGTDDDALIMALIVAAREVAERIRNEALITQTWNYILDAWPEGDELVVPKPPLQSVSSITYKDEDGEEATFSSDNYIVDTDSVPGRVVLASGATWPSESLYPAGAITVQFTAGYGDEPGDVPQHVRQAMLLMIGHWYENRETTVADRYRNIQELPMGAEALLWMDRGMPGYAGW